MSELPVAVQRLIRNCISSMVDLEVLLLLQRDPSRWWTAEAATAELRTGADRTADSLRALAQAGLLDAGEEGFRFDPRSAEQRQAAAALAEAYARSRPRVLSFMYQRPNENVTLFADAFRLRRKGRDRDKD
jgi:hypothetical protein